jgi:hypothetical protein
VLDGVRVGGRTMTALRNCRVELMLIGVSVVLVAVMIHLARRQSIPRIVDEHGTNLAYVYPDDPRCHPTATTRDEPGSSRLA